MKKLLAMCNLKYFSTNRFIDMGCLYFFLNPYSYSKVYTLEDLEMVDSWAFDGNLMVQLNALIYGHHVRRYSFDNSSVATWVFEFLDNNSESLYIWGGKQNEVDMFVHNLKRHYSKIVIAGCSCGYGGNDNTVLKEIVEKCPRAVIIGLGSPKQEKMALLLKKSGISSSIYTCGGFISQASKSLKYFPPFYTKFRLHWFYRLIHEPHILKRLALNYPKSIITIFRNEM